MMDDVYGLIKKHWPLYSQFSTSTMDGIHVAITEVRNWHPKCETCEHRKVGAIDALWCMKFEFYVDEPKRHGCLQHTALRGEEE